MNKHACELGVFTANLSQQLTHTLSFVTNDLNFVLRWVSVEMNWPNMFLLAKETCFPAFQLQPLSLISPRVAQASKRRVLFLWNGNITIASRIQPLWTTQFPLFWSPKFNAVRGSLLIYVSLWKVNQIFHEGLLDFFCCCFLFLGLLAKCLQDWSQVYLQFL